MNIVCFALFLGMMEGVNFFLHYAWKQVGVGFAESIHVGTGRPTCCPWSISFCGIDLNFLWGLGMRKENKKVKIVGKVDSKFCKENNIEKYSNFNIVQSLGLNYHTIKHAKEFISLDSYNKTMIGINSVINNPYYKIYDPQKNSIKYYKKIIEFVCVVVNLTDTQGYVSTFYPVKKSSIDKIKYNKKKETIKN